MKQCRKNTGKRLSARSGFSLIEIMLVMSIMGVLAAVVVINLRGKGQESRIIATRTSIKNIGTAIEMYELSTGQLPDTLADLTRPLGDQPPLIRGDVLTDSWGTGFDYSRKGTVDFELRSAGPDRQMGTEDDITN